ncbi:DUF6531 domain-containing protein [Massilia pinisoli]|uniref:DUF6531 domain-containing protein n=1 Tax=Massilia pinisoli TaxID=1772194 RepID=A0ABT1ZTY3_9BURK|nr:RHS repeat-associated core domain-containing protein [Massilia pinisoli]MCS0583367.1 DUF6531 domain-containing protein [Massilia pinisoli]
MLIVFMLTLTGRVSAGETAFPVGTKGWWYYINAYASGYAASPEEACTLNAKNHMGTHLVDMSAPVGPELRIHCKYPHFYAIGGIDWFSSTHLDCEFGYRPTPDGICAKATEPPPPLSCQQGQPGYGIGNPVIVASGAKVQSETDSVGAASSTLKVERTYRVFRSVINGTSGGQGWSFWFDRAFVVTQRSDDGRPTLIEAADSDGTYLKFVWNPAIQKYVSSYDKSATLEALTSSFDDWLLTYRGRVDRYQKRVAGESTGFVLVSSRRLDGSVQNYIYKPGSFLVQQITDERGRILVVTWGANHQVASISGPEGSVRYQYDFPWGSYPSFGQFLRLTSVQYVDAVGASIGTKQYHYEDPNNIFLLTGIADENGNRFASYAYDSAGRVISSEHGGGAYRYSFAYPDNNNRIVTDPLGAQRTLGLRYINDVGLVTGESQPGGSGCSPGSSAISHDVSGSISSRTDFNGYKICYQHDSRALETSRVSGLLSSDACPASGTSALTGNSARRTSTRWHPDFPLQTAVAEVGRITTYLYNGQPDAAGKIAECAHGAVLPNGKPLPLLCAMTMQATTDANGANGFSAKSIGTPRAWTYTYNANGQLLTSTGPQDASGRRAVETRTYYQDTTATHYAGDLASVTNAAGEATQYLAYSPAGLATSIRQPNGQLVTLGYGQGGRLLNIAIEDGHGSVERSEFKYDAVGNLTGATAPDGSSLTYAYDAAHRLTDVADNAGNRKHLDLDGMGNVVQEQHYGPGSELAWKQTRSFDVLNRLQFEQRGLQQAGTSFEYDRNGNLTKLIDQLGRNTTKQYDSHNRVLREQLPSPSTNASRPSIDYTYDRQDQLLAVQDPKGFVTRYTFDGFGERTVLSSPDTGVSAFVFDGAGNLTSSTDARSVVTRYAYDAAGRVTHAGTSSFEFGAPGTAGAGLLIVMHDDSGQTAFGYDGFGRLISKTQSVTGINARTFKVGYAYGASGAGTGHVSSVTYPSGNRIDIDYDSSGRPHSLRLLAPGAAQPVFLLSEISYRPFGAVSGWTWGIGTNQSNTYTRAFDLEGHLVSYPLGYPGKNGVIRTLHYDAAGRIMGTTHTGTARASALDQTYHYDDLDRLTGFDAAGTRQRYAYDLNGNRSQVTFGSASYAYTLNPTSNRLDATEGPAPRKVNTYDKAGNLTGDGTISYTYGANGRMETASAAGMTTRYRYNGRGERVVKTSSAGSTYYVYDEQGHLLGEYDATGKPVQETVYLDDLPVAVIKPGVSGPAVYDVYADHLHVPRVLTRASDQQMVWRWDHADPFGLLPPDENPSGLGTFIYNLRFPGQVFDKETNNHYNYFRDYDPQTGRYVQSDPIGLAAGINTYIYVGGDPLSVIDPYGLWGVADLPSIPQPALDFATGVADAASLGLGPLARQALDINGSVNRCSKAYAAGEWASVALGAGRMAYAGIAKVGAAAAADGAAAIAFRNGLKRIMRGPLAGSNYRIKNYEDLLAKYGSDEAIQAAAGRTNSAVNAVGADLGIGGAVDAATCGCH